MRAAGWVAALLLGAVLSRLPVFFRTFASGDEATYSALACAMLDGQWLYSGAVDHKPPLVASTYALVYAMAGRQAIHAIHLLSIVVVATTALLIGVLARRFGLRRVAARGAAATYVAWASIGPGKDVLAANGELLMALPALGALVVACPAWNAMPAARDRRWRWFLAGALAAVAALFKYQGAAVALPLAWLALEGGGGTRRRAMGASERLAIAALAGALVLAAVVGPYWRRGELDALAFWAWTYPVRYARSLDAAAFAVNLATMTAQWLLLSAGPLLLVAAGLRNAATSCSEVEGAGRWRVPTLVWAAGAAVGVASGGRFFLHYYLQLLPPLSLVAGVGLARLLDTRSVYARRHLRAVAALTAVSVAAAWAANAADHRLHPARAHHDAVYRNVGAWVASRSAPRDRIFVWGNSPEIYFYARRPMGTRFPFCNYQSGKIWGTPANEPDAPVDPRDVVEAAWPMLLADLEARRPAFVLDAAAAGLDRWAGHAIARYPGLATIVRESYQPVAVVNGVAIHARRDRAAASEESSR